MEWYTYWTIFFFTCFYQCDYLIFFWFFWNVFIDGKNLGNFQGDPWTCHFQFSEAAKHENTAVLSFGIFAIPQQNSCISWIRIIQKYCFDGSCTSRTQDVYSPCCGFGSFKESWHNIDKRQIRDTWMIDSSVPFQRDFLPKMVLHSLHFHSSNVFACFVFICDRLRANLSHVKEHNKSKQWKWDFFFTLLQ